MKAFFRKISLIFILTGLSFTAHAQFGSGIVYDPTNLPMRSSRLNRGRTSLPIP